MLAPLKLNYLIEGEFTVLTVDIESNGAVSDLGDLIKQKSNVYDAYALILWKVNIQLAPLNPESLSRFTIYELLESGGVEIMYPRRSIETYWIHQPYADHLQVFVFRERRHGKRKITPTFGVDKVNAQVEKEIESLRPVVEAFLRNPELPTWNPPDLATPSNREFLTRLRLPAYGNGNPSILFHNLHVCDSNHIKRVFGNPGPMCICNTSGSGKTRRLLESLTIYWGFYIVAAVDDHGVGVRDLEDALNSLNQHEDWVSDISPLSGKDRVAQSNINSRIASNKFQAVLAARTAVFRLFLDVAVRIDGHIQEKHKRIWLQFQLFNLNREPSIPHPFIQLQQCFRSASPEALDFWRAEFRNILNKTLFSPSPFIIALDESQKALRSYPHSFVSSTDEQTPRSIVREIARVFQKLPIKLVVSGTALSLEDLEGAMVSGVSKWKEPVPIIHELGTFDTWPQILEFLKPYLPDGFLYTPSGCSLQRRIREYLMGRFRFSATYLECLLKNGLESPHTLLDEFIKAHTTCLPGNSGPSFASNEPKLHIELTMKSFEWDRLELDTNAVKEVSLILQSHLIQGSTPSFGPVTTQLVEYGIACFCEDRNKTHSGQIVEPLAFLSVMKWLEAEDHSLPANIRDRLANPDSHGSAYGQLIIVYLLQALRYPTLLSSIFTFHNSIPLWAYEMTYVVGRLNGTLVPVDIFGNAPQNPGLGVVEYADDIQDILDWLTKPNATAVLISSFSFGPDVMVRCEGALLMGQLKSYTEGNTESFNAQTTSHALTSLHQDHWFKESPPEQRQKLFQTLGQYHVLYFVGGYPLPPDLNPKAESVSKALDALGPDVVLATVNLDVFRTHFTTDQQTHDVLRVMEEALARR